MLEIQISQMLQVQEFLYQSITVLNRCHAGLFFEKIVKVIDIMNSDFMCNLNRGQRCIFEQALRPVDTQRNQVVVW